MNLTTEQKNFYKTTIALVIPLAMQNLINVGVQSADVIMLGRAGETVLAGASLGGQLAYIMNLMLFGLTSGMAVLTSQYWGKGDMESIKKVLGIAMRFCICVTVVFTAISFFFPHLVMRVFSSDESVIAEGIKYMRILSFSYLFSGFTLVYLSLMRSVERVSISTVVYVSSLMINIVLNYIFIFGHFGCPAMGIQGAALSTLIARISESLIVLIYNRFKNDLFCFHFRLIAVKDSMLQKDFFFYSLPVIINELLWGAGMSANAAILGQLGSPVAAANSVVQIMRQLSLVVCFGISSAAAIITGKVLGENNIKQAEINGRRLIVLSIITGALGGIVILLIRPFVVSFMNLSPEAKDYLNYMLTWISLYSALQGINCTMIVGIFRAGGDTKFGLFLDAGAMWITSIFLGFLAAFVFKFPVKIVYLFIILDEFIKLPLATLRYRKKKWLKNVTR